MKPNHLSLKRFCLFLFLFYLIAPVYGKHDTKIHRVDTVDISDFVKIGEILNALDNERRSKFIVGLCETWRSGFAITPPELEGAIERALFHIKMSQGSDLEVELGLIGAYMVESIFDTLRHLSKTDRIDIWHHDYDRISINLANLGLHLRTFKPSLFDKGINYLKKGRFKTLFFRIYYGYPAIFYTSLVTLLIIFTTLIVIFKKIKNRWKKTSRLQSS